ncbi:MAG: YwqG family protein [Micropepsaceae bacterium]
MRRQADTEKWTTFLRTAGLDSDLAKSWASFARPNIRLLVEDELAEDTAPPGATKFGGSPDLPVGTAWPARPAYAYAKGRRTDVNDPVWSSAPLTFIAQVNLADIARLGSDLPLPTEGLLAFFYDAATQPWGFDPADGVGTCILYTPAGTSTERLMPPGDGPARTLVATLEPGESLPDWAWLTDRIGRTHQDIVGELEKLNDTAYAEMAYAEHAFGGWPAIIQNPLELECQLASHGIYVGGPQGYQNEQAEALIPGATDWRLMLQIDSSDALGWTWGDVGRLYFMCRNQDIATHSFDRAWTILQCT